MTSDDAGRALELLLERERQAILSGRLEDLSALPSEKAWLLDRLSGLRDADRLRHLVRQARRNQALLEAAGQGLRDIRERLSEIRRAAGTLDVYSQNGERQSVSTATGLVTRRA